MADGDGDLKGKAQDDDDNKKKWRQSVDAEEAADAKVSEAKKKKKVYSKSMLTSKMSLKKVTESGLSSTLSEGSSSSLAMKRQSEFEKLIRGPRYQNTYRLDSKKPFKAHEVQKILASVVNREVSEYPMYESLSGMKVVQTIAADIRNSVRVLNYDRYKICVVVYLGEKKLQGFQAAFRALWDNERDGYATYYYQSRTYFVSATCYGIYHD